MIDGMDYLEDLPGPEFTAKDLREIVGLSYRQLNDWDGKGLISPTRAGENGWRKFTCRQVFSIGIESGLRDQFQIPPQLLVKIHLVLDFGSTDWFVRAVKLMNMHGGSVVFATDFANTFILSPDIRLNWLLHCSYFSKQSGRPRGLVLWGVNDLVNRILEAAGSPHRFHGHSRGYDLHDVREARRLPSLRTNEKQIIDLIRQGCYESIEVSMIGRHVKMVFLEKSIQPSDSKMLIELIEDLDFQTVKVVKRDGTTASISQRIPVKPKIAPPRPGHAAGRT